MALLSTPGGNEYPDDETPIVWTTLRDMARNRDARDREQVKAASDAAVEAVDPRLSALEARDGLDAGALTDTSVASVISQPDTQTRGALEGALDARYAQPGQDETITGDWTVSKGQTTAEDRPRFGLERKFVQGADGALYDSDTRLEMRISEQQSTTQAPPGYSMAEIALIDTNSGIHPIVSGESAVMAILSNRFRFNRRLEVMRGGRGRATLDSGTNPTDEILSLKMHNPITPEFRMYGPGHPTDDAGMAHLIEGRLRVEYSPAQTTTVLQLLGKDSSSRTQDVRVNQYQDGTQSLDFRLGGTLIGSVSGHASSNRLRLSSSNGVEVTGGDMSFDASRGPVLRSPDGASWRVTVSNTGALSAVKL